MYRYSVDNAITYTSEDLVLFREAPFACWMERLTLENPEHGIPPDVGSHPPRNSIERQDDLVDTLRGEGKDVSHVSWDEDEPMRRAATLEAMRRGADFIVDGQLALGPLAGSANLLVRTSGYSELGDFLYTPCDTQGRSSLHSAFRLCFLADLLHSLQGQLPPQMLIIRDGDDLVPLQTEDHIYHYRAVKQRFMEAMRNFRKHRMPDPAESSHFGRWSDCAHEVLKQRLLQEDRPEDETGGENIEQPLRKAAASTGSAFDLDAIGQGMPGLPAQDSLYAGMNPGGEVSASGQFAGHTLAEQAQQLVPGTYKPGPGYFRLRQVGLPIPGSAGERPRRGREAEAEAPEPEMQVALEAVQAEPRLVMPPASVQDLPGDRCESDDSAPATVQEPASRHNRRVSDAALQNLEFIGSSQLQPTISPEAPASNLPEGASTAPAPSLRDPRLSMPPVAPSQQPRDSSAGSTTIMRAAFEDMAWNSPKTDPVPPREQAVQRPPAESLIDMDDNHPASPPPVFTTADTAYGDEELVLEPAPASAPSRPFSDSIFNDALFTEQGFTEQGSTEGRFTEKGLTERGFTEQEFNENEFTEQAFTDQLFDDAIGPKSGTAKPRFSDSLQTSDD